MPIEKAKIVDELQKRGDAERARLADEMLPQEVDVNEHAELLKRLGVHAQDFLERRAKSPGPAT